MKDFATKARRHEERNDNETKPLNALIYTENDDEMTTEFATEITENAEYLPLFIRALPANSSDTASIAILRFLRLFSFLVAIVIWCGLIC